MARKLLAVPGPPGRGKGRGKGRGGGRWAGNLPPGVPETQPERYSETLWEEPRQISGLRTIGECCPPGVRWSYDLWDESRRSYAGYLQCPFQQDYCNSLFDCIRDGTDWKQPEGRLGPIPRKTAWMVSRGCSCTYRYGSIEVDPQEFPPWMTKLMEQAMHYCGITDQRRWPNSCNLNLYEDGAMSVGWHSDDERLFQGKFRDVQILSLSLGARRKFELRTNWPEEGERSLYTFQLGNGDMATMEGMTQKHYMHRVPKEDGVRGPRINLTWRWIVKHTPQCPAERPRG